MLNKDEAKLEATANSFVNWPHPLAGVSMVSQPHHRIPVSGDWGPTFSEIYVAGMVVNCSTVPSATPSSQHFVGNSHSISTFKTVPLQAR